MKKKVTIPKVVTIFKREIFLNIGKNRNSLAIKDAEKKDYWFTNLTFFLPHYGKKQTTKPALRSLRSLRLGTRQNRTKNEGNRTKKRIKVFELKIFNLF
jgi:hypothetical protein